MFLSPLHYLGQSFKIRRHRQFLTTFKSEIENPFINIVIISVIKFASMCKKKTVFVQPYCFIITYIARTKQMSGDNYNMIDFCNIMPANESTIFISRRLDNYLPE